MSYLFLLFIFWNVLAPLPPGYAINPRTGECGKLGWEDEYGQYLLFPPWEKHYDSFIQNGNAICPLDQTNTVETCCTKVGFTYVPGDMGKQHGIMLWTPVAFLMLLLQILPLLGIGLVGYWIIKWSTKRDRQDEAN
jgi:hypothetical protein